MVAKAKSLDDVMLAMDVVDTLRHREHLIEKELDSDERDQKLIERLRDIYTSQGMKVTDDILIAGVEALKKDRFIHSPPKKGFKTKLAYLYITRDRWMKWLGLATTGIVALSLLYSIYVLGPIKQLPDDLAKAQQEILSISKDPKAKTLANNYYDVGTSGLSSGNNDQAKSALKSLDELSSQLGEVYTLQIVSRAGQSSGIWRVPDKNKRAMNFYIIVEAVTPSGKILPQNITSEETGKTKRVDQWGVRVEESVFNRIRADKKDDGIIQNNIFGKKEKYFITPHYNYPSTGATIYKW